jgi:ubiquinone/menaquinone biosynthesis C-methylase UbiE
MSLAPIALFVYNRLDHTKQTIEALQKNILANESELFIFSDGAKNEANQSLINKLRDYLKSIKGFKTVSIIERPTNFGLAKSIITGVTQILNKYETIIVLEDDLVTSPFFLEYMNKSLEKYKDDQEVISVHGYVYPIKKPLPETFFIKGADCWGWATWKRGWNIFEPDGKKLLQKLNDKKLNKEFDLSGAYQYTQMLKDQIAGRNDSWAIRWHASAFLNNKLTLYPGKSLVQNIGFDNSGTHCTTNDALTVKLSDKKIQLNKITISENKNALKQFEKFLRFQRNEATLQKIKSFRKMNLNEIKHEVKKQIKKRTSKKLLNAIKQLLHKLKIRQVISGDYQIINNPNKTKLKEKFENIWQDESIPKQQLKITRQQIDNYQDVPAMNTLVNSIKKLDPNGKSILEIGCSTGYFSKIFKKANLNLYYEGCDYSKTFIGVAKKEHKDHTFKTCDATSLDYKNKEFDIVLSGCCLLHIIDYEKAIEESSRVSRDYVIFHKTPVLENNQTIYTEKTGYGKQMLEIIFSEKELIELFSKQGLKLIDKTTHGSFSIPNLNEPVLIKEYICKKI